MRAMAADGTKRVVVALVAVAFVIAAAATLVATFRKQAPPPPPDASTAPHLVSSANVDGGRDAGADADAAADPDRVPESAWKIAVGDAPETFSHAPRFTLNMSGGRLAISAAGNQVVVQSGALHAIDVATGKTLHSVFKDDPGMPHFGGLLAGTYLVAFGERPRGTTALDVTRRDPPLVLRTAEGDAAAVSPDGATFAAGRIVVARGRKLTGYDVTDGKPAWTESIAFNPTAQSLRADGDDVFVRTTGKGTVVVDARLGKTRLTFTGTRPEVIAWTKSHLLVLDHEGEAYDRGTIVRLHDRETGATKWRRVLPTLRARGDCSYFCTDAALDDEAAYVSIAGDGASVRAFAVASGAPLWRTPEMPVGAGLGVVAARGGFVFVAASAGDLRVLDAKTGTPRYRRGIEQPETFAFAEDGSAWVVGRRELVVLDRTEDPKPPSSRVVRGVATLDGKPAAKQRLGVQGSWLTTDDEGRFEVTVRGGGPCAFEPGFGGNPRRPILEPCDAGPFTFAVSSEDERIGD